MYVLLRRHRLLQHGRLLVALQAEAILALLLHKRRRVLVFLPAAEAVVINVRLNVTLIREPGLE